MMSSCVTCDRQKLKILQSVIVSNAVDVVDVLATEQTPSNVRFHDKSVFKAILTASDVDADVSAFEPVPASGPVAVSLTRTAAMLVPAGV
jgi:hypothetical protein